MKKIISLLFSAIISCNFVFAQDFQPVKILSKPTPVWRKKTNGTINMKGAIRLRVEFLGSGEIGKVNVINGLPFGATEAAIDSAKRIQFKPAYKNGQPVNSFKVIEYIFDNIIENFVSLQLTDQKAEAIIQKAIQKLGGDRYLQVKTLVGRGNFNQMAENGAASFSSFVDYIVFPDKERTEFKSSGVRTIQVNVGETGWYYDGMNKNLTDQTPEQIAAFRQSLRTSLDNLLRGFWRKENAKLEYVGRREASLGKRNEAVRLTYPDGFTVDFEFAAPDGAPAKILYKRKTADGEETKEETRFAQFIETNGISAPFILDFYRNGKQTGRANYSSMEFNTPVPDSLFAKPTDAKKLK